ncbi:hypothetical protein CYLTODRAFT_406015 [Cylindrobasidium torrendii FP15055 ss-10]|uniref:Uncharacterized protein n=1 Tax=Cylindrobasidium torrendii FP15055 ss-10 TaxID=1314674 RepID=A0A0D7BVE0_9AGAR|nr:hypothetical protein CYLTODRAFT_406015 [Cylindrobasidium torrendii FP15055 ss-10]
MSNAAATPSSATRTTTRPRPASLRLDYPGISDPRALVGKVLTSVYRSPTHPALTLNFDDNTSYQASNRHRLHETTHIPSSSYSQPLATPAVLVDGYHPTQPGVPKAIHCDPNFQAILDQCKKEGSEGHIALTIVDCAIITLSDKAFEHKRGRTGHPETKGSQWNQSHLGIAFKFAGQSPKWHCVWAMLEDIDSIDGACVFRSYDDVYLKELLRSARKPKNRRDSQSPTKSSHPPRKRRALPQAWE